MGLFAEEPAPKYGWQLPRSIWKGPLHSFHSFCVQTHSDKRVWLDVLARKWAWLARLLACWAQWRQLPHPRFPRFDISGCSSLKGRRRESAERKERHGRRILDCSDCSGTLISTAVCTLYFHGSRQTYGLEALSWNWGDLCWVSSKFTWWLYSKKPIHCWKSLCVFVAPPWVGAELFLDSWISWACNVQIPKMSKIRGKLTNWEGYST